MTTTAATETNQPSSSSAILANFNRRVSAMLRKDLFFVFGCPKSGTTWMQYLLDAHPHIACRGETNALSSFAPILQLVRQYNEQSRRDAIVRLAEEESASIFGTVLLYLMSKWGMEDGVSCVGEKTPQHAANAQLLAAIFPQARFIHMVRDPRDVCVSGWFHNLRRKGKEFSERFPAMRDYAAFIATEIWPVLLRRARLTRDEHPDRVIEVRYEDLYAAPEATLARVLRFLHQDDAEDLVRGCVAQNTFERLSGGRRPGEEDPSSFYRSGTVGDWKSRLDDECVEIIETRLGELMAEYGYECAGQAGPASGGARTPSEISA